MWKPGSKNPANGRKKTKKNKSPQKSIGGAGTSSQHEGIEDHSPHVKDRPVDPATHNSADTSTTRRTSSSPNKLFVKNLSGSTLNMRFMQRHEKSRSDRTSRIRTDSKRGAEAQSTQSLLSENGTGHVSKKSHPIHNSSSKQSDSTVLNSTLGDMDDESDEDMDDATGTIRLDVATPADMYGSTQVATIGRRSFGGHNPQIAEAWHSSQRSEREDNMEVETLTKRQQRRKHTGKQGSRLYGSKKQKT